MGKVKDTLNWESVKKWAESAENPANYIDNTGLSSSQDLWQAHVDQSTKALKNGHKNRYNAPAGKVKYSMVKQKVGSQEFSMMHPQENWILHHTSTIQEGDTVIFRDEEGYVVEAKFLEFMDHDKTIIIVQREDTGLAEIINWHDTVVFVDYASRKPAAECSCGARHTSVPTHHLSWCDVK